MIPRTLSLLTLALSAFAQNATFIAELVQALQSEGLTSLASAAQSVANTTTGQRLLQELGQGPQTVFAPNNAGFEGAHPNITSDPELLAEVLSYHILPGTFALNATPAFPNTTVARTLFNSSDLVFLEGNKNQVLAWTNDSTDIRILNQNTRVDVTVVNSTTVGNLTIHTVNAVIDVPGEFTAALDFWNLTAFQSALESAGLLDPINFQHGVTVFAPNDAAFGAAASNLSSLASNQTALRNVFLNHVINGTSVYTGNLLGGAGGDSGVTSAAGEGITSAFNSSGSFVTSGNATAKIVQPDIVLWNGVVHIIDTVLLNTESDQQAAESAASSASEQATSTSSETETGPIGFTPSPTSPGGTSNAAQAMAKLPVLFGSSSAAAFVTALAGAVVGALVVL